MAEIPEETVDIRCPGGGWRRCDQVNHVAVGATTFKCSSCGHTVKFISCLHCGRPHAFGARLLNDFKCIQCGKKNKNPWLVKKRTTAGMYVCPNSARRGH